MDGATFIEVFPFWAFDRENYYTENSDTIYATLVKNNIYAYFPVAWNIVLNCLTKGTT